MFKEDKQDEYAEAFSDLVENIQNERAAGRACDKDNVLY